MQVQPRSEFYVPIGGGCLSGTKLVHLLGIQTASEIFQQMNVAIGIYVCMYVCMYACMYTFVYVLEYIYEYMCVYMYVCMNV